MKDLLLHCLSDYGEKEISGYRANKKILKWIQYHFPRAINDNVAWCSTYLCYKAEELNYFHPNAANARSWLDIGLEVNFPQKGDVVVLWRESRESWKGHVGLFVREDKDYVWLLGGNQSNEVRISKYPKYIVLGYRRLYKKILD